MANPTAKIFPPITMFQPPRDTNTVWY